MATDRLPLLGPPQTSSEIWRLPGTVRQFSSVPQTEKGRIHKPAAWQFFSLSNYSWYSSLSSFYYHFAVEFCLFFLMNTTTLEQITLKPLRLAVAATIHIDKLFVYSAINFINTTVFQEDIKLSQTPRGSVDDVSLFRSSL